MISLHSKIFFLPLCLLLAGSASAQQPSNRSVRVIFDSDIGPDYDDVGAITILHVLEKQGSAKILATVASNKYEGVAAVLDIFNTYFHEPGIPVGVPKGDAVSLRDSQHWTDTLLARYPHAVKRNADAEDAVRVYRKTLAAQPDHSVTIVTTGFLTNLARLLDSKGDDLSPLNGEALVRKKVKLLVSMAGKYPSGKEFNIDMDVRSSKRALENWPTPVIYSGFEIGVEIHTGLPLIHDRQIRNSPVKDVFRICIPMSPEDARGRMSWDETAVWVAVKGYRPYYDLHPGKIRISDDGTNHWDEKGKGQFYLVKKAPAREMQDQINRLLMELPAE